MRNFAADTVVIFVHVGTVAAVAKESTNIPTFSTLDRGNTGNKRLKSNAKFQRMPITRYRASC
jgi:hypothetical protein